VDAAALTRELAGAHTANNSSADSGESSTSAGTTVHDTFAALDAGDSSSSYAWAHTGSHQAEAGYQDPTLGWISVRADASGGGIHATLVSESSDAAQTLSSHLSELNAYLTEQRTPVESLTVSSSGSQSTGMEQGANQSMDQGTGQQGQTETQSDGLQSAFSSSGTISSAASASTEGTESTGQTGLSGGVYISVMA
jgi:hypothetical protein